MKSVHVFCWLTLAEVTGCQEDYCANGGSCDEKEGEFICNCTSMWSGQTCKQQCKAPSLLMSIVFLLAQVYFGKMCKIRWILGKNCFNFCLRTFFTGKGDWKPPEGWNATDPQYHETFDSGFCFQNEDIRASKMPWVTTSLNIRK